MRRTLAIGLLCLGALAIGAGCSHSTAVPLGGPDSGSGADTDADAGVDAGGGCASGWHLAFAVRAGGPLDDDTLVAESVSSLAALGDGAVLATGSYLGDAAFGEGHPNATTLPAFVAGSGYPDGFAARFAADGALEWVKRFGGAGWDYGSGIAPQAGGSALVLAGYGGAATFGPGEAGETPIADATYGTAGGSAVDFAIAELEVGGGACEQAIPAIDAMGVVRAERIIATADGGAIVAGEFLGEIVLGPGGGAPAALASSGDSDFDVFIARFDGFGAVVWARHPAGTGNERRPDVALLADGAILLSGSFTQPTTFGGGGANETLLGCASGDCAFLAAYSGDGTLLWARGVADGCAFAAPVVSAAADGGFALAAEFQGACTFAPGEPAEAALGPAAAGTSSALLARYGGDGAPIWARQITALSVLPGPSAFTSLPLAELEGGEIAMAGAYAGGPVVIGGGEEGETSLSATDSQDIFVALFAADGDLEWAAAQGGPEDLDAPLALAADGADAFFVGGAFAGHARFGACADDAIALDASGRNDAVLLRFARDAR